MSDGLAVECLGEEVHRGDAYGYECALVAEALEVARKRGGVAAHIGDVSGGGVGDEVDSLGCKPRARRVHDQHVGVLVGELAHGVTADNVNVIQMVDLEVATQVAHCGTIRLNGSDVLAAARKRQRKGAGTAVKVHGDFLGLWVQCIHDQIDKNLGRFGVDLEKRRCRKAHLRIADILGP